MPSNITFQCKNYKWELPLCPPPPNAPAHTHNYLPKESLHDGKNSRNWSLDDLTGNPNSTGGSNKHTIKEIFVNRWKEPSFKGEPSRLSWPSCSQGTGSSFHFYKLKASWNVKSRITKWVAAKIFFFFFWYERSWAILNYPISHTQVVLVGRKSWSTTLLLTL